MRISNVVTGDYGCILVLKVMNPFYSEEIKYGAQKFSPITWKLTRLALLQRYLYGNFNYLFIVMFNC